MRYSPIRFLLTAEIRGELRGDNVVVCVIGSRNEPSVEAVRAFVAHFAGRVLEDAASILWKHVTARRFRFVYHYHPEIELIYFAQGGGIFTSRPLF
jgi:hypothetical protein